ncbi:sensor domain-containing diguanylate cyclase [Sulfurimonas sp. HSL3-7]|uniref:sensor domain-containing diguanylate cyclase n=1 Tax=Sulfonitrofixus jiaomeiensis TaxID=3131938 RepID=UPI0031F78FFC
MNLNYRTVLIITFLLVTLSVSLSVINYIISLQSMQKQLTERSLPLTVDNIYTEIQKHIIEPNLVSSMMAHDTFLKEWLINNEVDVGRITKYLETIKNKYGMFTTFLVSEQTGNYYTSDGLIEKVKKENPNNAWYFSFKKLQNTHEINLDFNAHIDAAMIMFINHKIMDDQFHMIGATGIGLKISYINDMLKWFRQQYHFKVLFLNEEGKIVLNERGVDAIKHLKEVPELYALKKDIISKTGSMLKYEIDGEPYLLNTKYIPELDLYLLVEAKVTQFTEEVTQTFYLNLILSLLVTALITVIILLTVKGHHRELEYHANNDILTRLPNRRAFNEAFQRFFLLYKRKANPITLLFFDLDDFKQVNDTLGHNVGDRVLVRVAEILRINVRETDLMARWGGEEFIVALIDTGIEDAYIIAEKIKEHIENDVQLHETANRRVTASFGLTGVNEHDTIDSLLKRVDDALYEAKKQGKNTIVVR